MARMENETRIVFDGELIEDRNRVVFDGEIYCSHFSHSLIQVIGGSYTYVATTISIILAGQFSGGPDPIEVAKCVEIGLPELILLVFASQDQSSIPLSMGCTYI